MIQVENELKHCRKELIERNNDVKTSTSPAPVSEKGSSRYLLTKHSGSTLGVESGHGRNLIADSPHNAPSPSATTAEPPSHGPTPTSSPSSPTPSSPSQSSPTPSPKGVDLPLPPNMFVPFPPSPRVPHPPPQNFRPIVYAPVPSPPNNENKKKQTIILAAALSGIIILIGLALCYREASRNKGDRDDRPLLVLTSSDYSGGMLLFFFLH